MTPLNVHVPYSPLGSIPEPDHLEAKQISVSGELSSRYGRCAGVCDEGIVSIGEGVRGGELPLWIGLPSNAELEFMHVVSRSADPELKPTVIFLIAGIEVC